MQSPQEQLEQINAAILKVEIGGQEVRIYNRMVRRADLGLLYKRKQELERQVADSQTPPSAIGGAYVSVFDRR